MKKYQLERVIVFEAGGASIPDREARARSGGEAVLIALAALRKSLVDKKIGVEDEF
jgi:hypothetical protein